MRSGSISQLGAHGQHLFVEVSELSFCTALWSKSVGAIEDCRLPQPSSSGTKARDLDAHRTSTSTKLATGRTKRSLDSSSDTVVLMAVSFCMVVSK